MSRARLVAFAAALVATCAATYAVAGPEDTLGLGARATALGGSYAARPGDFAAAYYNPAGMAPGGSSAEHGGFFELSLGFMYAHPTLHVTGANQKDLATPYVADTSAAVIGSRFSIGQPFHLDGLDMGFSLVVPRHLFSWSIRPDDDVQWAMLTDRADVLSTHAAIAYRVSRWLSLGVGLRVTFAVQTLTRGHVTDVRLEPDPQTGKDMVRTSTQLGTDAEVFGRVSPSAGVLVTPIDRLRLALVYRQKSYVDDWGNTRISGVPDIGDMGYTHHFAHYFEPTEVTVAASADLGAGVDVSADVTYNRWSEALSTNRNFFGEGLWGDTVTPAFGARLRATQALSLLCGYRFQKSPLDNFGGRQNLLDNDRHVTSMGFELDLGKLLKAKDLDARFTAAFAHTLLVERTETKDFRRFPSDPAFVGNPGYPSYDYGGHLLMGTAAVEARW